MKDEVVLISACLCGINCKYNGENNYNNKIENLLKSKKCIPVCAEQLGGLTTPRCPAEIKYINGIRKVITKEGKDVTENYEKGAKEIVNFAKSMNINKIILKSKSPSCGVGKIYNGEFNGTLIDGNGILTDLCIKNNIEVINIDEY